MSRWRRRAARFMPDFSAVADALASHAPPETLISFEWPDAVFVEGGLVGGVQLAWPQGEETAVPEWLVFGVMLRTAGLPAEEPGMRPNSAALEDEGFEDLGPGQMIVSFARHFMVHVDAWQQEGFRRVIEFLSAAVAGGRARGAFHRWRRRSSRAQEG